jgi:hypothetical protein
VGGDFRSIVWAFDLLALNGREARPQPLTEAAGAFAGPVGSGQSDATLTPGGHESWQNLGTNGYEARW